MTSRARLLVSIPFWILLVASLVSGALGLWIVLDRLGTMESGLEAGTATTSQVYGGQSWAVVGAVLLGAGVIGVLLTLAVAAIHTILPRPEIEVVESIDWTAGEPNAAPATTAAPVIAEDPDVEVPSTAAAPAAAHEEPAITTEPAPEGDDKRA